MTERLNRNSDFLSLLIKGEKNQRNALLETISLSQADFLAELLFNIVNTLGVSETVKKSLLRSKHFRTISNIKLSYRTRKEAVKKFKKRLLTIVDNYRGALTTLLS